MMSLWICSTMQANGSIKPWVFMAKGAKSWGRNRGVGHGFLMTREQLDAYNEGWAEMMVTIMGEQIERLKISDTGALTSSIKELVQTGSVTTIEHRFLMYGLYAAAGVGKGFVHGNGGDLLFMGDKYRQAHGYREKQVGAGLSAKAMMSPKFDRKTVRFGKNAGMEAALTSGEPRKARDWFFKKYYYSLHRLNETNAGFFGAAYQGLTSSYLEQLFAGIGDAGRIRSNRF